jgi:hypothetical protein
VARPPQVLEVLPVATTEKRPLEVIPVVRPPQAPEVLPVVRVQTAPRRRTTVISYSFITALWFSVIGTLFGLGFLVLTYPWLPTWGGWAVLVVGLLFLLGSALEGKHVFQRGPILVLDERGFTDTRETDPAKRFVPWDEIVGASSFRLAVNYAAAKDTLKIHRVTRAGREIELKVDAVGLTLRASRIADLINRHLREMGRDMED